MSGRLPTRPLSPLREELERHGITFSEAGSNPLAVSGKIEAGEYHIRGDVSSQFISGLLFALSLGEQESELIIEGRIESAPYIHMTQDALSLFGAPPLSTDRGFLVGGKKLCARQGLSVEGDWSNAAFALCAGAMGKETVSVSNLHSDTHQGDRAILTVLRQLGATVRENGDTVSVSGGSLHPIRLDASQIPDLVPVLATVASVAEGKTRIYGASRLRLKESDRLFTVSDMLRRLGANIEENDDGLTIEGVRALRGGSVSSYNDHRIAMSAAVAASVCESAVEIDGAEAVNKSYPAFWEDASSLGAKISGI
jgi:3-phosphoshikimate 1-carboxyvinyltransferase